MLRSLLAAVMTCALVFSFVGCAEEATEPVKPPVVDTKKAAETADEVKKEGEAAKTDAEKKAEEAADAAKKALEKK